MVGVDQRRSSASITGALFWHLALCSRLHFGCHCDARSCGRNRWAPLPELDLYPLSTGFCRNRSRHGDLGFTDRAFEGSDNLRNQLRCRLRPQRLCTRNGKHDRRASSSGHGGRRIGFPGVHWSLHSFSAKALGPSHCSDFRRLGRLRPLRTADRRLLCLRRKLAWRLLGFCGPGVGCHFSRPAFAEGSFKGRTPGISKNPSCPFGNLKCFGFGHLSIRSDEQSEPRHRFVDRGSVTPHPISQTGCRKRKPDFSTGNPQPFHHFWIRLGDALSLFHGDHLTYCLRSFFDAHPLWCGASGGRVHHCS